MPARKVLKAALKARDVRSDKTGTVVNVHNLVMFVGLDTAIVSYTSPESGRAYRSASWSVHRFKNGRFRQNDPEGHWQDQRVKTFSVYQVNRDKALMAEAAKTWGTEQYGITDWEWLAGWGWFSAAFLDAAEQAVTDYYAARAEA